MFDGPENPNRLRVQSLDAIEVKSSEVDAVDEVDFSNPESIIAYKEELHEQVVEVIERANHYFIRESTEHKLRNYDKIGLQNSALVLAFYSRFAAQCDQLTAGLEHGFDVSALTSQLNRSYDLIQNKIEIINQAFLAADADILETNDSTLIEKSEVSHEETRLKYQSILRTAGVGEKRIENLTKKSIDVVFNDSKYTSDQNILEQEISRILSNAEKEATLNTAFETPKISQEVLTESTETAIPPEESLLQSEAISHHEIDTMIEKLTHLLPIIQQSEQKESQQADSDKLIFLKSKLLHIKRRISHYQEPHSIENDAGVRGLMLIKSGKELQSTLEQAQAYIQSTETTLHEPRGNELPAADLLDTKPVVLAEPQSSENPAPLFSEEEEIKPVILVEPSAVLVSKTEQPIQAENLSSEKNNVIIEFEKSKLNYVDALNRLTSIRSAMAIGAMPKAAIDEFLDPAIDEVERAQRSYRDLLTKAKMYGEIDISLVTLAESKKLKRTFFSRETKPELKKIETKRENDEDFLGIKFNDPISIAEREPGTPIFSNKAKVQSVEPVSVYLQEQEAKPITETNEKDFIPAQFEQFRANYKPNLEAFNDDYQSWIDSIQGVHPKKYLRIFNSSESGDAYETIKNLSITQVRNMIRSPETTLSKYKIKPEDFDHWRRFLTSTFMVPGMRSAVSDEATFAELAQLGFMYDTLSKNRKAS